MSEKSQENVDDSRPNEALAEALPDFGDFSLDLKRHALLKNGKEVHLRPQAFDLLKCLLENMNSIVSNLELEKQIWGKVIPGEKDLTQVVLETRRALGDCRDWIVTRHTFGRGLFVPAQKPKPLSIHRSPQTSTKSGAKAPEGRKVKTERQNWKPESAHSQSLSGDHGLLQTPMGPFDGELLFSSDEGYASALRLWGRGDACLPPERLILKYKHQPYELPPQMRRESQKRIARLTREAKAHNKIFFDGPCVRLLQFHHNQDGPEELDFLELTLGPVGWFQFEGTNGVIRERLEKGLMVDFTKFVSMAKLQDGQVQDSCPLSNMIGNAVTIFTKDGKLAYQRRGQRQSSVPGLLTSAVAENVNRCKDDVFRASDRTSLVNPIRNEARLGPGPDNKYRPKGTPDLVATVRRGIREETSPLLLEYVPPSGIKLTGLAFGLDNLHPDALWIVLMDVGEEKFKRILRDYAGKDSFEGSSEFVPASFEAPMTKALLRRQDWVPAGKASLIRALEIVRGICPGGKPIDAFKILAAGTVEYSSASRPYHLLQEPRPREPQESSFKDANSISRTESKPSSEKINEFGSIVSLSEIEPTPASRVDKAPEDSHESTDDAAFDISMDSRTFNAFGELISGSVAKEETIVECQDFYRQAAEDSSFAIVYGTRLRAKWLPVRNEEDAATSIISELPPTIYLPETIKRELADEVLWDKESHRNQIRKNIQRMGTCMGYRPFVRSCKDWITRESQIYLGIHASLFKHQKHRQDFIFGKNYDRDAPLIEDVPALFGPEHLRTLLSFVPKFPDAKSARGKHDRYDDQARLQFVKELVVTDMKLTYQWAETCRGLRLRLPNALRAAVMRQSEKTSRQRLLHELVVRHALFVALCDIAKDRTLLIPSLISVRGRDPFNHIRERLEEFSLIKLQPDDASEEKAQTLINEIKGPEGAQQTEPTANYVFTKTLVSQDRNSLREINKVNLDLYEERLFHVFPELKPRTDL